MCVCGLSRVNFHLFPELVAHRCALCTLSSAFSAIQSTPVRAPSSCTSSSVHSSHNDDFHCVHGKLHRINFSSRRLVFPKFIFLFFILLLLSLQFVYCLWAELNTVFSHFACFSFFVHLFSCYFSVQSFYIFFFWRIFNANFSLRLWAGETERESDSIFLLCPL